MIKDDTAGKDTAKDVAPANSTNTTSNTTAKAAGAPTVQAKKLPATGNPVVALLFALTAIPFIRSKR